MSTVAQARAALVALVGASDAAIDPPACYVYSNGSDLERLGGGGIEWGFRVTCAVSYGGDDATASSALATFVAAKLTTIWQAGGWRIVSVGPDVIRTIAGGEQFTADIAVSIPVEI